MPRPVSVSRVRLAPLALLIAAGILLVSTSPAFAHDECINVPTPCVSISSGEIALHRSGSQSTTLQCPSTATYAWGASWDRSSRAVSVAFWPWSRHETHFTVTNWSPARPNTVTLYIGCSATSP